MKATSQRTYNNLTAQEKLLIKDELNSSENMRDFILKLATIFDLETCRPGTITKQMISGQMINLVLPMINPNLK